MRFYLFVAMVSLFLGCSAEPPPPSLPVVVQPAPPAQGDAGAGDGPPYPVCREDADCPASTECVFWICAADEPWEPGFCVRVDAAIGQPCGAYGGTCQRIGDRGLECVLPLPLDDGEEGGGGMGGAGGGEVSPRE